MKDSSADPLAEFLKVNLHGTVNLVEQAARAGVKRLIYVSSVKVNGERTLSSNSALAGGNCGRGAFTESDRPNPQDPYAVSKWPGVKGNFIRLLAAINRGIPLPLAGARNARSLIYVGNLVDALITCATHPAAAGQTYLVSDGHGVSTAELVKKIAHALGHPDRSFYLPPALLRAAAVLLGRADQVDRLFDSLCVNDSKIRGELSWLPPYSMEQGLRETANWFLGEQPIG
jgi:nucleoside-diphosphate-sugar epimerase